MQPCRRVHITIPGLQTSTKSRKFFFHTKVPVKAETHQTVSAFTNQKNKNHRKQQQNRVFQQIENNERLCRVYRIPTAMLRTSQE
jgi:hypothetical protein